MANANGWGDGASNNDIGWGQGADNAIGWGSVYSVSEAGATDIIGTVPFDSDAQAFITAASITDATQQSAINTLVVDLKGYNIWTKMKALYPFVGGTAATHKWNLKDPRDLDAAFRLVFSGGWTHNSNGITGNGINTEGFTKLIPNVNLTTTSGSLGFYLRNTIISNSYDFASNGSFFGIALYIDTRYYMYGDLTSVSGTPSAAFYGLSRVGGTHKGYRNGTVNLTSTSAATLSGNEITFRTNLRNYAFGYIAEGLTDAENSNLYTAVQAFQTTLGRSIGTQTVSDADAQAFVTNAGIVDQVEANAINNLVIGMKADGLWTKMQAIYPFVGGTATTHKFNLKNPLDTNAAFRLVFSGGGTHSVNGYQTNGVNAFAETNYNPSVNLTDINSNHISIYSRTNNVGGIDMGGGFGSVLVDLELNYAPTSYNWNMAANFSHTNSNSLGHYINTRTASNAFKLLKNGSTVLGSSTGAAGATKPNITYHIGKRNYDLLWTNRQYCFASIGDGLTDTEAANFYTAVQTFQTALNRNV